jgi:hypothetical protein
MVQLLLLGDLPPKRRSQSNSIPVRITRRLRPPRQRLPHQLTINNQSSNARVPRVHRPNYSNLVKIPTMKTQQPKSPHFKLVHLNIRSLSNTAHLTQLKEFLSKTKTKALTLSETWLNTTITNAEIYMEGFTLYRQDRLNKRGGGVCAYIRNDIKVSKLKEISSVSENYFHQLWLKLQSKKLKSIVICISYRPPECPLSCLETNLKPSFVQALLLNKPIFILGDLNCNVMKDCPENTALGNFMFEMNLNQLIITPTRITDTSESLIDVIITSASHLVNERLSLYYK